MAFNFNREEIDLKQYETWLSEIKDAQSERLCWIVGSQIERLGVARTIEEYVDASGNVGGKGEDLKFHRALLMRFGLAEILECALHDLPGTKRYHNIE
jgi:hypothetical protein